MVEEHSFQYEFIPVRDFSAPSMEGMKRYIEFVKGMIAQGKPVVTCCGAGIGRTGTMLATYLVSEGYHPKEALEELMSKRRYGVEATEQKEAIWKYARHIGKET
jgi:atypical dual specificity phosphatase